MFSKTSLYLSKAFVKTAPYENLDRFPPGVRVDLGVFRSNARRTKEYKRRTWKTDCKEDGFRLFV